MPYTIKGKQCVWGTTDAGVSGHGGGIVVSATNNRDYPYEPVDGEEGEEVGIIFYDDKWDITLEVVCTASTQEPERGAAIQCGGLTGYVNNCRKVWGYKGKKQLSISAHGAAGIS